MLMEVWPESWSQQSNVDIDCIFGTWCNGWNIRDDDMKTPVTWPDFLTRVRHHFHSTRHVLRGWDVLLTRI